MLRSIYSRKYKPYNINNATGMHVSYVLGVPVVRDVSVAMFIVNTSSQKPFRITTYSNLSIARAWCVPGSVRRSVRHPVRGTRFVRNELKLYMHGKPKSFRVRFLRNYGMLFLLERYIPWRSIITRGCYTSTVNTFPCVSTTHIHHQTKPEHNKY